MIDEHSPNIWILCALCVLCGEAFTGCGRKGPPLPPIVYAPAAASEFTARRIGSDIVLQFKIPTTNTTGATPADLERVEVYAHTGTLPAPADYLRYGTLIATLPVKPPDSDASETGKSDEGRGKNEATLEQGAVTTVREELTPQLLEPGKMPAIKPLTPIAPVAEALETPGTVNLPPPVMRYYVVMGVSRKNKKGAFAGPLGVPVSSDLPPSPLAADATYTQDALTITWKPAPGAPQQFNVYEMTDPTDVGPKIRVGVPPVRPGNATVLTTPSFTDKVTFGEKKCYVVRTVATVTAIGLESDPSAPVCVTPVDTFPPAAPTQLASVSDEKGVNLIWEPNTEPDLGGYIVLRGEPPSETLMPLTPQPIRDTSYRDTAVQAGHTYIYAVVAVDNATPPNRSEESNRQTEVIR